RKRLCPCDLRRSGTVGRYRPTQGCYYRHWHRKPTRCDALRALCDDRRRHRTTKQRGQNLGQHLNYSAGRSIKTRRAPRCPVLFRQRRIGRRLEQSSELAGPVEGRSPVTLIELNNISKVFPGATTPSVDDVHLEIDEGELLCLLGPSGCGKSTTLRMIAGLETP